MTIRTREEKTKANDEKEFTCFLIDDDVDDQEVFLSVVGEIKPAIRCVTAINGQEAIEKLASGSVRPDLIFLDLNMPLMNGKQFLEACTANENYSDIPVVVLTTSSDKKSMDETLRLGARGYITKPDRFSEWGTVIRKTIDSWRNQ